MPLFFYQVWAIVRKDLKTEVRTKERLSAMAFFAFLVILIFNFLFKPGSAIMTNATPGIFWISVTFSGLLGLTRSLTMERQNDCMVGLRLTPADSSAIFLGKFLANVVTLLLLEAILLPLLVVFLNVDLWEHLPKLAYPLFLGTLGFASVGTLFAAMSVNTRLQEALLPILTLPVLVPSLLASVESFRAILAGAPMAEITDWLKLGTAFTGLFVAACILLFEYVVEE